MMVAVFVPVALGAQMADLTHGARVRVTNEFGRLTAEYSTLVRDSIEVVESRGVIRRLAFSGVSRIDLSLGRTRRAGARKGAKIGAAVGAGAGAVYVAAARLTGHFEQGPGPSSAGEHPINVAEILGGAVVGSLTGTAVGSLVGSSRRAEEWRQVYPLRP